MSAPSSNPSETGSSVDPCPTPVPAHNRFVEERLNRLAAAASSTPTIAPNVAAPAAADSSGVTVTTTLYGPSRDNVVPREERDKHYWSWTVNDVADDVIDVVREREKNKVENMVTPEAVEALEVLTVTKVNLHIRSNALEHRTLYYECTKVKDPVTDTVDAASDKEKVKAKEPQAVVRRGQDFTITVHFSRAYQKEKDDLIFIFDADEDNPGVKKLKERFTLDEDNTTNYKKNQLWGARILQTDDVDFSLQIAIYPPGDCVVGEWDLKIKTKLNDVENEDFVYLHPTPIIILFNPWSKVDRVYFTEDKKLLDEYILNTAGTYYTGASQWPNASPWTYGQFEDGILHICLSVLRKAFGFKMTPVMSDPVQVSRALTRIMNSPDDMGVLVGNWSKNYSGGESPSFWTSSTAILRKFEETGKPVKFGQCWVFSHLLTAVCRALGLPCRSVTTYGSAHDTDNTCTIDCFFTKDGKELENMKSDSIWNFHVWNEVWLLRPDLSETGDYDGWHAIDATPQEQSHGVFQCGPCPVKAVKKGEITVGYDTPFVFGEVNADVVNWIVNEQGEIIKASSVDKKRVGSLILTKLPDGKGHNTRNRLNITGEYKFPEGSAEERIAVKKALRFTQHGKTLFPEKLDLEVSCDLGQQPVIGQDIVVTAYVKNATSEDKDVTFLIAVRTCKYWDHSNGVEHLAKEDFPKRTIAPGNKEEYKVTVSAAVYLDKLDDQRSFFVYACARDLKADMPYSDQKGFTVGLPQLEIQGTKKANSGEPVTVTVSFTNPFAHTTLTHCSWQMNGELKIAADDKTSLEKYGKSFYLSASDVPGGGKASITLKVYGEIAADEADGRPKTLDVLFASAMFDWYVKGCIILELKKKPVAAAVTPKPSTEPTPAGDKPAPAAPAAAPKPATGAEGSTNPSSAATTSRSRPAAPGGAATQPLSNTRPHI